MAEVDWDTGKARFADFLAKRQSGLNSMYLQNLYEQNRARKAAEDAAKPGLGKFLGGALPGALMGAFLPGGGLKYALGMGLGGGLMGSGLLGQESRAMTPSMLSMAAMGMGRPSAPPTSAAGTPLATYQPGAAPMDGGELPPLVMGGGVPDLTPPPSPYGRF